jgi:hypothetical protein
MTYTKIVIKNYYVYKTTQVHTKEMKGKRFFPTFNSGGKEVLDFRLFTYFKDCNSTFTNFEANTHKMAYGFLAFKLASKGGLDATFSMKISKSLYPCAYCTVQYTVCQ